MSERDDMLANFEAIVWATDPRRAIRRERQAALAGQIARTAIIELRRPRLVESSNDGGEKHG